MYFLKAIVLGFATLAAAQSSSLKFTDAPLKVEVGKTYSLTYSAADASSPVTITLKNGPGNNLKTVEVLGTSTSGTYSWTVSNYPDGDYALEIDQGTATNYWGPFPLTGGSAATSSAASSSAASSSAASSAASSSATASSSASASASASVVSAAGYTTGSSSSASGYASLTASSNSTLTFTSYGTAGTASGTGYTTLHRNTTLSSATLKTKTSGKKSHKTATITSEGSSSTGGASATSSHPGASSVPTGAASNLQISSPFALFFGVMGAMAYLN